MFASVVERRARLTILAAVSAVCCACGDDEGSGPTEPAEPPTIEIASITATGNQRWENGRPLQVGCDLSLVVTLGGKLENWTFSSPGGCGQRTQCGFAVLRIDPSGETEALKVLSLTPFIPVNLSSLVSPPGMHSLRVELRRGDGSLFLLPDEQPVFHQVSVELRVPTNCEATGMGGAAGAGGSGGLPAGGAGGLGGGAGG